MFQGRLVKFFKYLALFIVSIIVLYLVLSVTIYRLSNFDKVECITSEVVYDFVDIQLTPREIFETGVLSKSVVTLAFENKRFFIESVDKQKLWKVNPRDMQKLGYTLSAKVCAQPLMFGGYGVAEVSNITKIDKQPIITK
ncbi:hypothetical protein GCM10008027_12030 [Pseudoalteromonas gelatinilytica]|uniref:Uncharacterized protein n=1 Tax=Pseudoalteromonas gelatinilytica TaxID=1703256 RepID=A0ABQ1TAB4_9GAMM|nr:hypothetical protein GCM10008027_12030 [Pseudoalteromonas profundi]|tara:strand:- start:2277 stop:2696 length:420 start_codon:yes stop_codon:yes gene_type:complete